MADNTPDNRFRPLMTAFRPADDRPDNRLPTAFRPGDDRLLTLTIYKYMLCSPPWGRLHASEKRRREAARVTGKPHHPFHHNHTAAATGAGNGV